MNNELFDSLIREQLAQQTITPSAGVKKVLAKKMFFHNIWIFHKIKLFLSILTVSGIVTAVLIYNTNSSKENTTSLSSTNNAETNSNEISFFNNPSSINQSPTDNSSTLISTSNEDLIEATNSISTEDNTNKSEENTVAVVNSSNHNVTNSDNSTKKQKTKKAKANKPVLSLNNKPSNPNFNDSELTFNEFVKKDFSNIQFVETTSDAIESESISLKLDTTTVKKANKLKTRPFIFKEVSFELFAVAQNKGLISNEMLNETYNTYYWDFYANQEVKRMPTTFGFGVNYAVGTYRHKLLFSSGLNYTKMLESKTKYDFNEVTSQAWLDLFGVNEFSWVNTYGLDTCTTCFYARSTEDLKNEIKEDYNRFSYVNIPLQLGYQFNFGMVTMSVKGGLQSSILSSAKGLYVKQTPLIEGEQYYYWKGLEMTTLGRKNDMMKSVYFSYMFGADVKLRLTSKFDAVVGYNFIKSAGTISNTDYLYSKKYTNQTFQLGFAFYPNRIPVIKKF